MLSIAFRTDFRPSADRASPLALRLPAIVTPAGVSPAAVWAISAAQSL